MDSSKSSESKPRRSSARDALPTTRLSVPKPNPYRYGRKTILELFNPAVSAPADMADCGELFSSQVSKPLGLSDWTDAEMEIRRDGPHPPAHRREVGRDTHNHRVPAGRGGRGFFNRPSDRAGPRGRGQSDARLVQVNFGDAGSQKPFMNRPRGGQGRGRRPVSETQAFQRNWRRSDTDDTASAREPGAWGESTDTGASGRFQNRSRHSSTKEAQAPAPAPPPGLEQEEAAAQPLPSWNYLDKHGIVRGPFDSPTMSQWFQASYFKDDLPVKREQDSRFTTIANVLTFLQKHDMSRDDLFVKPMPPGFNDLMQQGPITLPSSGAAAAATTSTTASAEQPQPDAFDSQQLSTPATPLRTEPEPRSPIQPSTPHAQAPHLSQQQQPQQQQQQQQLPDFGQDTGYPMFGGFGGPMSPQARTQGVPQSMAANAFQQQQQQQQSPSQQQSQQHQRDPSNPWHRMPSAQAAMSEAQNVSQATGMMGQQQHQRAAPMAAPSSPGLFGVRASAAPSSDHPYTSQPNVPASYFQNQYQQPAPSFGPSSHQDAYPQVSDVSVARSHPSSTATHPLLMGQQQHAHAMEGSVHQPQGPEFLAQLRASQAGAVSQPQHTSTAAPGFAPSQPAQESPLYSQSSAFPMQQPQQSQGPPPPPQQQLQVQRERQLSSGSVPDAPGAAFAAQGFQLPPDASQWSLPALDERLSQLSEQHQQLHSEARQLAETMRAVVGEHSRLKEQRMQCTQPELPRIDNEIQSLTHRGEAITQRYRLLQQRDLDMQQYHGQLQSLRQAMLAEQQQQQQQQQQHQVGGSSNASPQRLLQEQRPVDAGDEPLSRLRSLRVGEQMPAPMAAPPVAAEGSDEVFVGEGQAVGGREGDWAVETVPEAALAAATSGGSQQPQGPQDPQQQRKKEVAEGSAKATASAANQNSKGDKSKASQATAWGRNSRRAAPSATTTTTTTPPPSSSAAVAAAAASAEKSTTGQQSLAEIEAEQERLAKEEEQRRIEENQQRLMRTVTQANKKGNGAWQQQSAWSSQSRKTPTLRDIERQEELRKKQQTQKKQQRAKAAGLTPAAPKPKSWLQAAGADTAAARVRAGPNKGRSLLDIEAEERTKVVKKRPTHSASAKASSKASAKPATAWAGKQPQPSQTRASAKHTEDQESFWGAVANKQPARPQSSTASKPATTARKHTVTRPTPAIGKAGGVNRAARPTAAKGKGRVAKPAAVKEAPIRKDFMNWCRREIKRFSTEVDAETLVKFLLGIAQPEDVVEYVTEQLGERARPFAKAFLQKRTTAFDGDAARVLAPVDDEDWQPSKSGKNKKKRRPKTGTA